MWWDKDYNKAKRLRKASFRKWSFIHNLKDSIAYKKATATAIKLFTMEKRENFKKFAITINFRSNSSYAWLKCRTFKNQWGKMNLSHETVNLQLAERINNPLNKISPPWAFSNSEIIPDCMPNEFFDAEFDFFEFNTALEATNEHSAPGMDEIDYGNIKKLPINNKLMLFDIYKEILITNSYPPEWSE